MQNDVTQYALRSKTFLVVGDANADIIAPATRFPAEGDDLTVSRLEWASGGSAANVATALALLGADARLLARVGTDPAADVALQAAQQAGVELALVQRDAAVATGVCYALVSPGGERTFLSFRGANVQLSQPQELPSVEWLHIAGHALLEGAQRATALALIDEAARRGVYISLDLCLPLVDAQADTIRSRLDQFHILFGNAREMRRLGTLADAPDSLLRVTKRGEQGCQLHARGVTAHFPAFATQVVDTNGCGDAFVAAFLHSYTSGCPPEACAEIANAAGALAATSHGAAPSLPSHAALHEFLASKKYGV